MNAITAISTILEDNTEDEFSVEVAFWYLWDRDIIEYLPVMYQSMFVYRVMRDDFCFLKYN